MGNEHLGKRWLLMDHADNRRFFQAHDDGVHYRRDRRYAPRDGVEPGRRGRCEMERPARMSGQPFLYLGMFVGRVVVDGHGKQGVALPY
jgi:hypothetical protein